MSTVYKIQHPQYKTGMITGSYIYQYYNDKSTSYLEGHQIRRKLGTLHRQIQFIQGQLVGYGGSSYTNHEQKKYSKVDK